MNFTLTQLQAALSNARQSGVAELHGITTDSRKVGAGDLFVALRGEHFDAHDFLPQVAASGAAAVIAERLPEQFGLPALLVPDSRRALAETGRFWRQQFDLPVIGVTGSNGKTTVKEMIASILAAAFGEQHRLATSGNLNNEIGVPLTMFRLNKTHRAAVIEMGMNHPGEIAVLADIARPQVVLVNNAQREHQEFMQSVAAVAEENGSAILALPADGVAVFPAGDEFTGLWRTYAAQRQCLTFGFEGDADVRVSQQPLSFGSQLGLQIGGVTHSLTLQAAGRHNALNAAAAAACCHAIGIEAAAIVAGLQQFAPVAGRLQQKRAHNGALVIDDSYNANPDSVRAAIDVLASHPQQAVLVLGDMGEVGDNGAAFHEEIGAYARQRGITHLLLLGELVRHAASGFGAPDSYCADLDSLLGRLDSLLKADSVVLVKGSRFMKMERVVAHLVSNGEAVSTQQTH